MFVARHLTLHRYEPKSEPAPEAEPEVACKISPTVRITLLSGGCWAVQKRGEAKWTSVGYHGSFYHAARWLLERRPELLTNGELAHMDSLLRAYDVALDRLRVMAEPLSRENQQLKTENRKLQLRVAELEALLAESPQS